MLIIICYICYGGYRDETYSDVTFVWYFGIISTERLVEKNYMGESMPVKFGFDNPLLRSWLLIHQTYNLVLRCENAVFAKEGLTTEHHAVLMAIKFIGSQATVTDVARWLDRNPNTISLIADRMEKRGLVRRMRNLRDRRSVRLVITAKGREIFEGATIAGWELIRQMLSPLSEKEQRLLSDLLELVRQRAFEYLNPGETMEEIQVDESRNMARFMSAIRRRIAKASGSD